MKSFFELGAVDETQSTESAVAGAPAAQNIKKLPAWLAPEQSSHESPPSPLVLQSQNPSASLPPPSPTTLSPSQGHTEEHTPSATGGAGAGGWEGGVTSNLDDCVQMYFVRDCPAPSAGIIPLIVSRLNEFPLLKLGRNGVAEMRTIFFSSDGSELLWKGKRGAYDIVPIRKLIAVSLNFTVESESDSIAKLRESQLSFLLQFTHRNVMLAARTESERCMFISGVLCLRDQSPGCTIGREIWADIAPLLSQTLSSVQQQQQQQQQQPSERATLKKRPSVILGHNLLHTAANSTQQRRFVVSKPTAPPSSGAAAPACSPNDIVKEMVMQRRIVCAASDDIVINFRVQLLSDGTVIVFRDAAAHKEEDALEFLRSSFFRLSENGVTSHVWMSQVRTRCN